MNPEQNPDLEPEVASVSFEEIEQSRRRMARDMLSSAHNWKQDGMMINCTSCKFPHGFGVTPGYMLQGVDDQGKPILKKLF